MISAVLFCQIALGAHQARWRNAGAGVLVNLLLAVLVSCALYFWLTFPLVVAVLVGVLGLAVCAGWFWERSRITAAIATILVLAIALFAESFLPMAAVSEVPMLALPGQTGQVPLAAVLATLGALLYLGQPINDLCRSVLARMRVSDDVQASPLPEKPSGKGWQLLIRGRSWATIRQENERVMELRGGRFIGPLERWLLLITAVAGQPALIAAIIAAKGIGRFPELAADRARGAKAEEFLVGSLVSWGNAGLAAILIVALAAH